MQFSTTSGASSPIDLIPRGVRLWALLTFKGMKNSNTSASRFAEIELTVGPEQPFERRKIFSKIGDPDHAANSEGYRNMGMVALTRMLESAGIVDPKNPASYEAMNGKTTEQILMLLDGKYVAIVTKIETGTGGHQDKNDVGEYLTPNETSSGFKNYTKLIAKDFGYSGPATAASRGGFGGNAAQPQPHVQLGGFGQRPLDQAAQSQQLQTTIAPSSGFDPNKKPAWAR